ncbi:serine hydrolase [Micromonospora parastrephiae]|uniref:serine hydrolase n=1 Tax=Micromonospora parastrephiae TaxID=2806101 RepID=UPI0028153B53|nr:serine hydrolase [Micromonospora parastrephiae]
MGERIGGIFADAGVTASLHVVDLDGADREVAVRADEQVVIASIFKILLVLEFARQVEAGQVDPAERVLVTAADLLLRTPPPARPGRSPGCSR